MSQPSSNTVLTYAQVLARYRQLLEQHPHQALVLDEETVVILTHDAQTVCWAFIQHQGDRISEDDPIYRVALDITGDFDESAFCDGHWDGETPEQTLAAIEYPRFIDIPSAD